MKKSDAYNMAMAAVIRDDELGMGDTLEVLSVLMDDRRSAVWQEKREEKTDEPV